MKKFIVYSHMYGIKRYIGFTSLTLEQRLHKHHLNATAGIDTKFYRAIRKYGLDEIKSEVLYSASTQDEAKEKEIYYINKFDTYTNGYNMHTGGTGGNIVHQLSGERYEQYISKLSQATRGLSNPNHSGYSDEEVLKHGAIFYKENGNVFTVRGWQKYAKKHDLPQSFSKNRFEGSFDIFKSNLAKKMGVKNLNEYSKTEDHKRKLAKKSSQHIWCTNGADNIRINKKEKTPKGYKRNKRTLKFKAT